MRKGAQVKSRDIDVLTRNVTDQEIKSALFGINDNKAPGINGFNAYFFKRTWEVTKKDLVKAMQFFFKENCMYMPVNCTTLALIPKVANTDCVFRPIACCMVIYKVISK